MDLLQWLKYFLIKRTSGCDIKDENFSNKELTEELHKPKKRKVHSPFIENIWDVDLVYMKLIKKINKGFRFILCVIDIYSKCEWDIPLKDKKGMTITNAFQTILDESNCKLNRIWVDKCREFYNRSMKSWLKNDIIMYLAHNEGESVVTEGFMRILKNKIYDCMTSIAKNMYIDKLDDIDNKYISIYGTY